jgi:hypothetical protein
MEAHQPFAYNSVRRLELVTAVMASVDETALRRAILSGL